MRLLLSSLSVFQQDGMLKNKSTYEIMSPEDVGIVRTDAAGLVLGKHRWATGRRF